MIWGSGGSKSRLAKAAGAEAAGQMSDEKLQAVVARSTFRSQNVQNTRGSDHFWKLRCRKSARRCGAKHISKSKCTKHTRFGPLLEVEMSKKCTPLWREAHFRVKMNNNYNSNSNSSSNNNNNNNYYSYYYYYYYYYYTTTTTLQPHNSYSYNYNNNYYNNYNYNYKTTTATTI